MQDTKVKNSSTNHIVDVSNMVVDNHIRDTTKMVEKASSTA